MQSPQTQNTNSKSADSLMTEYISVVNRALDAHGSEFPLKQFLDLLERFDKDGKRVGVAIYSSDADKPHDYFTLRMNQARRIELVSRGKEKPDIEWKVSRKYLEKVAADPETYVKSPTKLDWDWIKSRIA